MISEAMDEELKKYLDGRFAEMATGFEEMATKRDLERVETTLVTEFHKWPHQPKPECEPIPPPCARSTPRWKP